MVSAETKQPVAGAALRRRARIAGVFYLLTFLTGAFAAFVSGKLVLYREAFSLAATACYVVVTVLFYGLFKVVDETLSLIAVLFSLVGCAISAANLFHLLAYPIKAINPLVLFGVYCLLIGYLIFRSTFLPRILGLLMSLGGLSWLTFISQDLAISLSPYNFAPGMLGEGALTVWLLVFGLNAERWERQAGAAGKL